MDDPLQSEFHEIFIVSSDCSWGRLLLGRDRVPIVPSILHDYLFMFTSTLGSPFLLFLLSSWRSGSETPAERQDDPTRRTGGSGGKIPAAMGPIRRRGPGVVGPTRAPPPGPARAAPSCSPAPKGVPELRRSWIRALARVVLRPMSVRRIAMPVRWGSCANEPPAMPTLTREIARSTW